MGRPADAMAVDLHAAVSLAEWAGQNGFDLPQVDRRMMDLVVDLTMAVSAARSNLDPAPEVRHDHLLAFIRNAAGNFAPEIENLMRNLIAARIRLRHNVEDSDSDLEDEPAFSDPEEERLVRDSFMRGLSASGQERAFDSSESQSEPESEADEDDFDREDSDADADSDSERSSSLVREPLLRVAPGFPRQMDADVIASPGSPSIVALQDQHAELREQWNNLLENQEFIEDLRVRFDARMDMPAPAEAPRRDSPRP